MTLLKYTIPGLGVWYITRRLIVYLFRGCGIFDFTDRQVANISSTFITALECHIQRSTTAFEELDLVSDEYLT